MAGRMQLATMRQQQEAAMRKAAAIHEDQDRHAGDRLQVNATTKLTKGCILIPELFAN